MKLILTLMLSLCLNSTALCSSSEGNEKEQLKIYRFANPDFDRVGPLIKLYYNEVNKRLKKANIKLELVLSPHLRSLSLVDSGELDGEVGRTNVAIINGGFKNLFRIASPIINIAVKAIVLKNSPYNKISDIPKNKLVIGKINGDALTEHVSKRFKTSHFYSYEQLLTLLKLKRIDLFLASSKNGHFLFKCDRKRMKVLEGSFIEDDIRPVLNNKYKGSALERELNRVIKDMRKSRTFEKIALILKMVG